MLVLGLTPTFHRILQIEEQRREWERTKEELCHVKKQVAEKDEQIVQLKTLVRKLNETLQKKDKDLQAVFAVLRAPQDAELTKKRKNELIDRLVMENQQRIVNAEAIADERKKELDRLKYSSKFLRFQELEVEIEEYRVEIERLRAKISTMAASSTSPGVVVGKLKLSAVHDSGHQTRGDGNQRTNKKLVAAQGISNQTLNDSQCHPSESSKSAGSTLFSSSKGRAMLSTANANGASTKESFVTKTRRRRAQDVEYYKQVRLAQLEAECELEENIHIRTAREVKACLEAENKRRHQQDAVAAALKAQRLREDRVVSAATNESPKVLSETKVPEIESAVMSDNASSDPVRDESPLNTPATSNQQPGSMNETSNGVEGETGAATSSLNQTEVQVATHEPNAAKQDDSSDTRINMTYQADRGFESVRRGEVNIEQPPLQGAGEIVQEFVDDAHVDYEDEENDEEIGYTAGTSSNDTKAASMVVKPHVLDNALEISDNEEVQEGRAYDRRSGTETPQSSAVEIVKNDPEEENSAADGELSYDENLTERDDVTAPSIAPPDGPTSIKVLEPTSGVYDEEDFDEDLEKHTEIEVSPSVAAAVSGNTDSEDAKLQDAAEPTRLGYQYDEADSSADEKYPQGFLVDLIDPHTKLVGLDLSEKTSSEIQDLAKDEQMMLSEVESEATTIITPEADPVEDNSNDAEQSAGKNYQEPHQTSEPPPSAVEREFTNVVSVEHTTQEEEGTGKAVTEDFRSGDQAPADSIADVSQPENCFVDSEADAMHANDAGAKLMSDSAPLPATQETLETTKRGAELARLFSGPVDNEQESKPLLQQMGLDLADMKEAMESAARMIQQFWRRVVAVQTQTAPTVSATADLDEPQVIEATPTANVPDEQPEVEAPSSKPEAVSPDSEAPSPQSEAPSSEAVSPEYTPYSTPRDDSESDEQQ